MVYKIASMIQDCFHDAVTHIEHILEKTNFQEIIRLIILLDISSI